MLLAIEPESGVIEAKTVKTPTVPWLRRDAQRQQEIFIIR